MIHRWQDRGNCRTFEESFGGRSAPTGHHFRISSKPPALQLTSQNRTMINWAVSLPLPVSGGTGSTLAALTTTRK